MIRSPFKHGHNHHNNQGHPHDHEDADADRTNPYNSEGFELEIDEAGVISDDDAAADDNVDEVSSVSSSSKKSTKKKKKKYCGGGAIKTTLGLFGLCGLVGLAAALIKVTNDRASTEFQLATNKQVSPTSSSKSGKGCKSEFKVCVINPFFGIFSWLEYITDCNNKPFALPDEKDFTKEWKKYVRNCSGFWGNVFFLIQYVTVYIVNLFCGPARRALNAGAVAFAPATRALNHLLGLSDINVWLNGIDLNSVADFFNNAAPSPACDDAGSSMNAVFVGDMCIDEMVDNAGTFATYVDTCLNDDGWDWNEVEDYVDNFFAGIWS